MRKHSMIQFVMHAYENGHYNVVDELLSDHRIDSCGGVVYVPLNYNYNYNNHDKLQ